MVTCAPLSSPPLHKVLDMYEARLKQSPYLAGPDFSLADLSHLPYTWARIHMAKINEPIDKRPHGKAWWEKIATRPIWQKLAAQQ